MHTCGQCVCFLLLDFVYVSLYRAPLLSLTPVHKDPRQIWERGVFEHVRHAG